MKAGHIAIRTDNIWYFNIQFSTPLAKSRSIIACILGLGALELTATIYDYPEDLVSHPVGAVPKGILEHHLTPVNRSLYVRGHAQRVIVVPALAQIHLGESEERVHMLRAVEVAGILRLVRHRISM